MKPSIPNKIEYVMLQRELAIRKARKNFWAFCKLLYPEFYKDNRFYLKELCNTLQDFYEDKINKQILIINMPPRHGKTFTARLFVLWAFGQNPKLKIITSSYNQILSSLFAQQTRDGIMIDNESIKSEYFTNIFPKVKIKRGDAAKGFWALDGSEEKNYLASSPNGTATGIGANYVVVDDIIKNAEEAYNENVLDRHWNWYTNTLVQRMESPRKQILIMTRWASGDLAGRMLEKRIDDVHLMTHKAVNDDGTMLCDDIMTYKDYLKTIQEMGTDIASANYQQEPIDIKGRLYTTFKTYSGELPSFREIRNYTDTADTGSDFLCSINYGVTFNQEAYILNVCYTDEPMEVTESAVAKMLVEDSVNVAKIESNNGGRGFARNVVRILKEKFDTNRVSVVPFTQTKNKESRIYSNSTWIMEHIYFPEDWKNRWPKYYEAMYKYQRQGKNAHDDAADATTGIAENCIRRSGISVLTYDLE